ncbi:MAG: hypothetical protein ACKVRO_13400 [Micropepsaceae bacterium]
MRLGKLVRPAWAAAAALAAVGAVCPALAGEPAVSALNFKVTAQGGHVDEEDAWLGLVQVTAPIAQAWGVQGEGGVFGVNGDTGYGLAGHVFTRDPSMYLLGAFGAWAHAEGAGDVDVGRIGIEGEYYLEKLTFSANTGYQFGDSFIDDTWFGEAQVRWYLDNDFALSGGVAFDDDVAITQFSAEWLVGTASSLPGLALRGDVAMGDNGFDSVMGGITYYIGPDASLKDRHRKQDPDSALFDLKTAIEAGCQAPVQQLLMKAQIVIIEPINSCGQTIYYPPG